MKTGDLEILVVGLFLNINAVNFITRKEYEKSEK